ncbi:uncharacterized protein LOC135929282 isoform X2 [Gordionus sp. m RMFG-2023]|uniref:uncharacterized protein LOC135929282 isoform X2 n=1 Tax=Gordionus sp. m RMFG-2023 TaxID=3053472 RepID=UPI0031FD0695
MRSPPSSNSFFADFNTIETNSSPLIQKETSLLEPEFNDRSPITQIACKKDIRPPKQVINITSLSSHFSANTLISTNSFYNKKYDYVRAFELEDRLLPNCHIVCRIDGKSFHKFSDIHSFAKPNDSRALKLMNRAAIAVMELVGDVKMAYGQSDEFSFFLPSTTRYASRRTSKILTHIVSLFTSAYVLYWPRFMPRDLTISSPKDAPILSSSLSSPSQTTECMLPAFDGRVVLYPTDHNLRDYISWRQVDCHINNLYNTAFWALVQRGNCSNTQAQEILEGSLSSDKHELMFSRFGINYNDEPQMYRKGSLIVRASDLSQSYLANIGKGGIWERFKGAGRNKRFDYYAQFDGSDSNAHEAMDTFDIRNKKKNSEANNTGQDITKGFLALHVDLINDDFWEVNPGLLAHDGPVRS